MPTREWDRDHRRGPSLLRAVRRGTHSRQDLARLRAGVGYGVLTGAFITAYTLLDRYAVKHAGVSPVLVDYLSNVVRLPLTVILVWIVARVCSVRRASRPVSSPLRQAEATLR